MLRCLVLFCLFVISASAQAGSWWDDFESGSLRPTISEDWYTSAEDSDYLSNEYNRTLAEGSSTSLKLISDLPNNDIGHANTGTLATAGANSVYFYDDGSPNASFRVGLDMSYAGPNDSFLFSFLGVGVSDEHPNATNQYVAYHDHTTVPIGISRSVGWHRLQMSWVVGKSPRLVLDTTPLTGDLNTTYTYAPTAIGSPIGFGASFHAQAFNAHTESGTTTTNVWLDDTMGCHNVAPENFRETFEGGFDFSYWTDFGGDVHTTSVLNHTSDPGSSASLEITPSASIIRMLALPHNRGYVSGWFYDDGTSTSQFYIAVKSSGPEAVRDAQDYEFGVGGEGTTATNSMEYLAFHRIHSEFGTSTTIAQTGIPRSEGWHQLEFGSYESGSGIKVRIDGQEFPGNIMTGADTVERLTLYSYMPFGETFGNDSDNTPLIIDDLEYYYNEDLPDLSAVEEWRAFE